MHEGQHYLEGHRSEGQARRPLNPTDPDLRSQKAISDMKDFSYVRRLVAVVLRHSGRGFFVAAAPYKFVGGTLAPPPPLAWTTLIAKTNYGHLHPCL